MAYAIGYTADGKIRYSDGTIKAAGSSSTSSNFSNYKPSGGSSSFKPYSPSYSKGSVMGVQTSSGGGGYGSSSGGGGNLSYESVLEPYPSQPSLDFDAMIAPALEALDAAVGPAQASYDADVAGIEAFRSSSVNAQKSALAEAQNAATQTKTRNETQAESDVNEQRRGYSEISQGIQAKYGGSTGTGAFATEIAGAQSLKNIGQVRSNLSMAINEIDAKLEEVRGVTEIAIQDIEDQAQAQKLQAKANLDSVLSQIRIAKGELQSRKAELASQAIQFYQQQVADVNARNSAFKQSLFNQQSAAEKKLMIARDTATQRTQELSAVNVASAPSNDYGSYLGTQTGGGTNYQPTNPGAYGPMGPSQLDEEQYAF